MFCTFLLYTDCYPDCYPHVGEIFSVECGANCACCVGYRNRDLMVHIHMDNRCIFVRFKISRIWCQISQ